MGYLLYLMFRCDFDVMESLENLWEVNTAEVKIQRDECERWKRKQTFTAANAERTGRLRPHTHRGQCELCSRFDEGCREWQQEPVDADEARRGTAATVIPRIACAAQSRSDGARFLRRPWPCREGADSRCSKE